jgi:hypothetical protein
MAKATTPHAKRRVRTPAYDVPQYVAQSMPRHSLASDMMIAKAIAEAVRATPGIVGLSPGLQALAATYGVNERLVGIVVRHPSPGETAVEVHVTVAMEAMPSIEAQGSASSVAAQMETSDSAALTRVANQVREAVYRAMQDLRLAPPSSVDILIDDIQAPV